MARDEAYREAEKKIEKARREGETKLHLSNMGLTEVPESIANLTLLKFLDVSANEFTSLPESLGNLTQLQRLHVDTNRLGRFPDVLRGLTRLRALYIYANALESIPAWINELRSLETLLINANRLTDLPDSLGELSNLTDLSLGGPLGGNPIGILPVCVSRLKALRTLEASQCELQLIGDWVGELTELRELLLQKNRLPDLPASLGKLSRLYQLSLSGNRLTDLPPSLGQLSNLAHLDLNDNPLNPDLAAAHRQGIGTVLQFLRERVVEEVVLNEAKLVLVGEGGVGKSSLLGALRGDKWVEGRDTTHGVEIKPVQLSDPDSGVALTLNSWDFGGQSVYRPTHQLFFSAPAVYLVVWQPREGPEQGLVTYWTKLIKHRAYDEKRPEQRPRVLVVATHGGPKERQAHIDQQGLRGQFGDLIEGFYHVDSKTGGGLDELKEAIAHTTASIPQVGRKVPGSWKRVIDAIKKRSEKDPYISYGQFEKLCHRQKVGPELAATYVRILKELGYLIHYADDEGLKDVIILKAEWLSKAISFVLEDRVLKEQNGLIHHSRLGELWSDPARPVGERYPAELHPVFLRLMERFDLSYRVVRPGDGRAGSQRDTSLIAQLVPGRRPDKLTDDWGAEPVAGDREQVQVCRIVDAETGDPVRAEGLMYQLIVRLHRYSLGRNDYSGSRHWQLGLLLDDDYNGRALVEYIDSDIRVTARAAYPERFLHMLCEEVRWLVEHFWRGLDCKIAVPCRPPCRSFLEVEALVEARREDRLEYPCAVCRKWVSIDSLLTKPPKMPEFDVALAELKEGQTEIIRAVDTGFRSVRTDLRILISQADERFVGLMTALVSEARDGPRLFSLTPVEPGLWSKPKWISQKLRLTLWCEHSRLPLPELWKDPKRGVYEFEQPREWLVKVAPYAGFVAGTLNLVLPVAGSAVKWALDDAAYKQIAEDLDLSQKAFSALLGAGRAAGEFLAHDDDADLSDYADQAEAFAESRDQSYRHGTPRPTRGALLRELQALLRDRDPGFGGLKRVQNKRHEYVWIHPRFETEYNPDPPVIPQRQ